MFGGPTHWGKGGAAGNARWSALYGLELVTRGVMAWGRGAGRKVTCEGKVVVALTCLCPAKWRRAVVPLKPPEG